MHEDQCMWAATKPAQFLNEALLSLWRDHCQFILQHELQLPSPFFAGNLLLRHQQQTHSFALQYGSGGLAISCMTLQCHTQEQQILLCCSCYNACIDFASRHLHLFFIMSVAIEEGHNTKIVNLTRPKAQNVEFTQKPLIVFASHAFIYIYIYSFLTELIFCLSIKFDRTAMISS